MAKREGAKPVNTFAADPARGYLECSQRPLHILVFLLPVLVLYELGATFYLTGPDGQPRTIAAWGMLARFFEAFGVFGLHLPAALLVTVLLIWHLLLRDPWRLRPSVPIGMAMESFVWTIPLTILAMVLVGGQDAPPAVQVQPSGADGLLALPWQARLTISAGAGLYEELLFRMIAIAAAHALLVDVMHLSNRLGGALAVLLSALAFTLYHRVSPAGDPSAWAVLGFYFAAGLYFGGLYLLRGFGLVVAVHVLYDILALVVIG